MKKLFFIAAIAGAALVSCTKNELAPSATEEQEIRFANPVSHIVTKVDLVSATYPDTEKFSVFADYHVNNYATDDALASNFTPYMRGTEGVDVTYSTTPFTNSIGTFDKYWMSTNAYYWPKDGYLTFAAYSPAKAKDYATINYNITNGLTIDDYVVKDDLTNQYDLMLSDRTIDQKSTTMGTNVAGTQYDGVQIAFKHILSAIKFKVATDNNYSTDGYTITLKSLTLNNVYSTGDITQFSAIDETTVDIETTLDAATVWSDIKTEESYVVTAADATLSTTAATFSDDDDADLLLVPQGLNHTATTNKVLATLVYTVKHNDMGGKAIQYTKDLVLDNGTVSTWDPGKRYIYNITIGMDKVVFAPTVTEWAAGGSVDL